MVRKLCYCALAAIMMLATANLAMAQTAPPKQVDEFGQLAGRVIITTVRPLTLASPKGYEPRVTDVTMHVPKLDRLNITIHCEFYGNLAKKWHNATMTVRLMRSDGTLEILGVDYTDTVLFPAPDMRTINWVIQQLNKRLARDGF
jgi:hypothetical protein